MPYVPPKYPGAIPTAEDLPDRTDDIDWLYAARYNELKKELRAALIELGTDPAGDYDTVKARLDAVGVGFVDRGDPADWDFDVDDLTTDGAWHDLDLSGLIPAGAKLVLIRVLLIDDAVTSVFKIRENGNVNDINTRALSTQVANVVVFDGMVVACDVNRVVEYNASNVVWTAIFLAVRGWWK